MVELDERTRRDLAALRERGEPSEQVRERVLAQLESGLGLASEPAGGGLESGAGQGGGMVYAAKIVAATLSLTAGGLLLLKTGAVLLARDQPRVEAPARVEPRESSPRPEPSPAAAPLPAPAPAPLPMPTPRAATPAEPTTLAPRESTPSPVEPDTFAAELALLDAARSSSDAALRLERLDAHRERFPAGVMASERDALRATTLCELGRLDEARVLAEQFLRDNPRSPHRARVVTGCAQLELD